MPKIIRVKDRMLAPIQLILQLPPNIQAPGKYHVEATVQHPNGDFEVIKQDFEIEEREERKLNA